MGQQFSEIGCDGGLIGLDQMNWGGDAEECWRFWKVDPCCCPFGDGVICVVSWWLLGLCSLTRCVSEAQGQGGCAIIPTCLYALFAAPCAIVTTRYNLRKSKGVKGNIVGDIVCSWCTFCLGDLQTLRASAKTSHMWPIPSIKVMGECKIFK